MRIDVDVFPFTGLGNAAVIVDLDLSSAEQVVIGVVETGVGTVTAHGYDAIKLNGADSLAGGVVYGTADLAAVAKKATFSQLGSVGAAKPNVAPNGEIIFAPLKRLRIQTWATGATPSLSGSIIVWKYIR